MAVNLKIKNDRKVQINPTNVETIVSKNNRFIDLKMDLQLLKTGNPRYFDQKIVNGTDIDIAINEDAVREYLINLLSCSPGDLYLNPDFGINLKNYIFEPVSEATAQSIGNTIYQSINNITDNIFISPNNQNDNYRLEKVYITVNRDNNAFDLEILFYIRPLDKQIKIFGNISARNGVYFYAN